MASKYRNAGQTCVCANRILVQSGIYDRFAAALVEAVQKLKVGPGLESGVAIGPLISGEAIEKVETLVGDAVNRGAKILTGGTPDNAGPLFYRPSVVGDVKADMRIVHDFLPLLAGQRRDPDGPIHRFGGASTAEDKRPRSTGIMEDPQHIVMLEGSPHEFPLVRPTAHPPRQGHAVPPEGPDSRRGRPHPLKGTKEKADGVLDLSVGIEDNAIILRIAEANWQVKR